MAVRAPPFREVPRSRISSRDSRPTLIYGPHRAARVNLPFDALAKIGGSFQFEFSKFDDDARVFINAYPSERSGRGAVVSIPRRRGALRLRRKALTAVLGFWRPFKIRAV
jgi:hypothetical protein